MALPIASMPVLTGEVAQRFEADAQANYQRYLNRSEEEKKADEEALERGLVKLIVSALKSCQKSQMRWVIE